MIKLIVPRELNLDAIPVEKLVNRSKYARRGQNRRQDHGTRGCEKVDRLYISEQKQSAKKRRDLRAGDRLG